MPRLILQQPHTHAGTTYPAFARIEVDLGTADWLIHRGIAIVDATPAKVEADSKPVLRKESKL